MKVFHVASMGGKGSEEGKRWYCIKNGSFHYLPQVVKSSW